MYFVFLVCYPMAYPMHYQKCLIDRVEGHTFLPNCLTRTGKVIDLDMNKGEFANLIRAITAYFAGVEADPSLYKAESEFSGTLTPECCNSG